jgi:hypothetical protein
MHPATAHALTFCTRTQLPEPGASIAHCLGQLTRELATLLPEDAEVTRGVWKMIEATDCFLRALDAHLRERTPSERAAIAQACAGWRPGAPFPVLFAPGS